MRRGLLIPLVASLFVLSFIESWAALLDAARAAGIPYPEPWPWMVDGFIVATALLVVEARRAGHSAGVWWPRLGLFGATALSTGIQATWAPQADWAWALHAWSPLAVLFSFECLVWLVFGQHATRPKQAGQERTPAPARLRAWLGSWDQASPVPAPAAAPVEHPAAAPPPTPLRTGARRPVRALTAAEQRKVDPLVAQKLAPLAISKRLRLPYPPVRVYVRQLEATLNGDRPKEPVP
jgi:hypothetical protein